MQQHIDRFVQQLTQILGENLQSIILYGSFIKGTHAGQPSDINLMVVLKDISLRHLAPLQKTLHDAYRRARIQPLFWSKEEMASSSDVFPIEFLDILENRKVLYGNDPFQNISIDSHNLRHQCEFELRSKLAGLRSAWIVHQGDRRAMEDLLIRSGTSFLHLFQFAKKIKNGAFPDHLRTPLEICLKLKRKEIKMSRPDIEKLYSDVHDTVAEMVRILDRIE